MWNDDWRVELKENNEPTFNRLCYCNNNLDDIAIMSALMAKYNPNKTIEDCLERMLEWVGDWNNQYELTDLTQEQYDNLLYDVACRCASGMTVLTISDYS